jgi:hypothetical protein
MSTRRYRFHFARTNDHKQSAELIMGYKPHGYLWIPNELGECHGSLGEQALDALCVAWCRYRGLKP